MKLNDINIWLTKSYDLGETLGELDILDVFGHKQAVAYYESGVSEFDRLFKPEGYIKNGYVASLLARENGISLILVRFNGNEIKDMGFAHINREDILNYEEVEADNLEIVQKEETKHKAKYMLKRGSGLLGSVTGLVSEQFVSANTHFVKGSKFILNYNDENGQLKNLILYSQEYDKFRLEFFLNTYYKKELPVEAKKIISKESSNCFIATACYRNLYSEEVIYFRHYRDNVLYKSTTGIIIVKLYYFFSPHFYKPIARNPRVAKIIKSVLDKIYSNLKQ